MEKKNEMAQGCGCERDMQKEIKQIVKEGEKPTRAQHEKKKAEVEAAFDKENKKK